jgi:hypothetical protein
MVFGTWDLNFGACEILGYDFQDMVFKTWDPNFGTWISHRGFTVASGHRHPLVILNGRKWTSRCIHVLSKTLGVHFYLFIDM